MLQSLLFFPFANFSLKYKIRSLESFPIFVIEDIMNALHRITFAVFRTCWCTWDWRDGSVAESPGCSSRGHKLDSQLLDSS